MRKRRIPLFEPSLVSILGLLEGVLNEVVVDKPEEFDMEFQSLVCWRGC